MNRRLYKLILLLSLLFSGAHAHARAPQNVPAGPLAFFSVPQPSLLPPYGGHDYLAPPASARSGSIVLLNLGENALMVKTDYIEKQAGDDFRSLTGPLHKQGEVKALATSSIIKGLLNAEGELAYNSTDGPYTFGDGAHRLMRFGLKGSWTQLTYGAEYRSVGKEFVHLAGPKLAADQEGGELWAERKFGIFAVKGSLSRFTDNVADDPTRPLTTRLLAGPTFTIAQPSWPILSFFYSGGLLTTAREPPGFRPQRGPLNNVGASLFYGAAQWDATVAASYSLSNIASRAASPSRSSRVETNTPVLSLGLNYRPSILPISVNAFGSYTRTSTSDSYTDANTLNLSAALVWNLGETRAGRNTVSLGGTFNRYLDAVTPGASNRDLTVWLRFKIAGF